MTSLPEPPKMYKRFIERFPELGEAWQRVSEAGRSGPFDAKTAHLLKLGISAGAMRQGAVHSAVRKAIAQGATRDEVEGIVPMLVSSLGFPGTVAVYSWILDELDKKD